MNNLINCRLCNNTATKKFSKVVLGKYPVDYFECINCDSLQTEKPFWLDEAYENNSLSYTDTGAAQRNFNNLVACLSISKVFNLKNVIDIGGGDGLLCRMLRDYGINCYVKDKYAIPTYAQGFTDEDFDKPDLVIGFEVLEHLPHPDLDILNLFECSPDVVLLSTSIYSKNPSDWWYLSPESGQHVFFYSKKALNLVAKKYKYSLSINGSYILFVKKKSPIKKFIARLLLIDRIQRFLKIYIVQLSTPGVWEDYLYLVKKNKGN